ncbi:hypothetical protein, partial [Mycoplasmopsis arginini]|uniref:hypothetical protein n=1 Tax=Mycoplasmopsis arginini TaxID=2094 RepID=UPI00249E0008
MIRDTLVQAPYIISALFQTRAGAYNEVFVRANLYLIPVQLETVKSDTRSTRTYEIVPLKVELGVNDIQAVVVATRYTSFLSIVRLLLVAPHIDTVQVPENESQRSHMM